METDPDPCVTKGSSDMNSQTPAALTRCVRAGSHHSNPIRLNWKRNLSQFPERRSLRKKTHYPGRIGRIHRRQGKTVPRVIRVRNPDEADGHSRRGTRELQGPLRSRTSLGERFDDL